MPGLMQGKRGLVMGVANDHSIAWGIAKTLAGHGAELAFTYQGEALGRRVKPLAQSVGSELVLPCDVEDITSVDARVSRVVDVKTPGSREAARNRIENFESLTPRDQLKFVICSREDYDWSKAFLQEHGLPGRSRILFSPSYNEVSPTALADWILADRLPVRFQFQLHKVLWGDTPGK